MNMIQDATVNQHQHMIFIIISKRIILQTRNCNSDLIAIMTPQKGVGKHQPA